MSPSGAPNGSDARLAHLVRLASATLADSFPADAQHVVSVSGGKDSTATYLLAVELLGRDGFMAVFADTGWEHEDTYSTVARLPTDANGPPIRTVTAKPPTPSALAKRRRNLPKHFAKHGVGEVDDRTLDAQAAVVDHIHPFRNLVMMRGGFPSARMRTCTEHLKIRPIEDQVVAPLRANGPVVSWQGVRADESPARRLLPGRQRLRPAEDGLHALHAWRPLLDWTLADVLGMARRHGVALNPLYGLGFSRVGCYPCIFARQAEIARIAELDPARIDEIEAWEHDANRLNARRQATFFQSKTSPRNRPPFNFEDHGIRSIVAWAKAGVERAANDQRKKDLADAQQDVLPGLEELFVTACDEWGACE